MATHWTEKEDRIMLRGLSECKTLAGIASRLKTRSEEAVRSRLASFTQELPTSYDSERLDLLPWSAIKHLFKFCRKHQKPVPVVLVARRDQRRWAIDTLLDTLIDDEASIRRFRDVLSPEAFKSAKAMMAGINGEAW